MIKVNIRSKTLKESKRGADVAMECELNIKGAQSILEEELYKLLKEFEKRIPDVWINALERIMMDRLEKCCGMEGDDEE